ncbi:hypothetical protein [Nocardia brasiliensis]|uniref:hypothetical protein n=1 Tax=Nocardia brasiliensis TaxID=37326 RepID=UPI0033E8287E
MTTETLEATTKPDTASRPDAGTRTVSVPLGTLLHGALVIGLLVLAVTFGVLWHSAEGARDRDAAAAVDQRHAEQVATDYAVGASTIDHQNLPAWMAKLKQGTTTALAAKFDATGPALEQLLTPLRWTSTATPIAAKTTTASEGIYQVDVFLDVTSSSAQTPDGVRTTVTYRITVDRGSDWQISDVGGMDGALPSR